MQNISVNYYGYFTPFGGYGIANMNWVKHLIRQGVDVSPHGKFMPTVGTPEWEVLNSEERDITLRKWTKYRIGIIETTPFDFHLIENDVKVCNTMIESDQMGSSWVEACSRMDHILVPSEFQRQAFIRSGLPESKVHIIPHGTETEKFPHFVRKPRSVYTFGIAGYLNERKGVFDVIRAFASEFDRNESVRLLLHSTNPAFGYYRFFQDSRIVTDCVLLSQEKLNEWYQSIDCFVFPSRAEGVGQPPREAMASGLPVILTNYSGLEEICNPDVCYPLTPIRFEMGVNPQNLEQPGRWAKIEIRELMYQMRYVYEHQEEARQKGEKAAQWIRDNFSWEICATKMKNFLTTL